MNLLIAILAVPSVIGLYFIIAFVYGRLWSYLSESIGEGLATFAVILLPFVVLGLIASTLPQTTSCPQYPCES